MDVVTQRENERGRIAVDGRLVADRPEGLPGERVVSVLMVRGGIGQQLECAAL